jgi:ribosomal protein S27E
MAFLGGWAMLEKCPDCGHEMSQRAVMCPNCGAPGPAYELPEPEVKCKGPVGSLVDGVFGAAGCLVMIIIVLAVAGWLVSSCE